MFNFTLFFCMFPTILGTKFQVSTQIDELIVGGKPVTIEEMPHIAGLYYRHYFFCASSIVSQSYVVTAAHCLYFIPPSNHRFVSVRAGTSKVHIGGQSILISKCYLHPKFSVKTIDYDVAVIELKTPFTYNCGVKPLPLADTEPREGQEVRVSGWGYLKETGSPSRKLQSVLVKMVNRKTCAKNYEKRFKVTERMICAFEEKKDACYGDSGGPLIYKGKLAGIVSVGEGCARQNFPGVYTSVANKEIKSFIQEKAKLKNSSKKKSEF